MLNDKFLTIRFSLHGEKKHVLHNQSILTKGISIVIHYFCELTIGQMSSKKKGKKSVEL